MCVKCKERKRAVKSNRCVTCRRDTDHKLWFKKAEASLHLYIRKRACTFQGYVECYTCRKMIEFERTHAGHFWHGKLDLDERNLKPQCGFSCNVGKSGNLAHYSARLIEDYGAEWFNQLKIDAARYVPEKDVEKLKAIYFKYEGLLKSL